MMKLTREQAELVEHAYTLLRRLEALRERPFKELVRLEFPAVSPSRSDPLASKGFELLDMKITREMVQAEIDRHVAFVIDEFAKRGIEIADGRPAMMRCEQAREL